MTATRATVVRRLALPALLAVAALVTAPAAAYATDATIEINPGNVPTTAEGHGDHSCDQVPGGETPGTDGWVFVLPGNEGEFESVSATYTDLAGVSHTFTTGVNGGIYDGNGTSKAWILTPAGWTLTGATAVVEGGSPQDQFNLTHTCPATEVGQPSDSASPSPSDGPSDVPSGDASATPGTSGGAGGVGDDDELANTGMAITGVVITGAALAAVGTALVLRRRRAATASTYGSVDE